MGYVDYAFYTDVYLGNFIPEREFSHYGLLAKYRLDKFKRMYTVAPAEGDEEKLAMCAMAEAMYKIALAQTGMLAVSSASIGSVSVSYGSTSTGTSRDMDLSEKGQARAIYNAACIYLDIYRG